MKVYLGETGLKKTWQQEFKPTAKCKCGGTARIAFVAFERGHERGVEQQYVYCLHDNKGKKGGYWPHDVIAIAVYFCPKCFKVVTDWNQA